MQKTARTEKQATNNSKSKEQTTNQTPPPPPHPTPRSGLCWCRLAGALPLMLRGQLYMPLTAIWPVRPCSRLIKKLCFSLSLLRCTNLPSFANALPNQFFPRSIPPSPRQTFFSCRLNNQVELNMRDNFSDGPHKYAPDDLLIVFLAAAPKASPPSLLLGYSFWQAAFCVAIDFDRNTQLGMDLGKLCLDEGDTPVLSSKLLRPAPFARGPLLYFIPLSRGCL